MSRYIRNLVFFYGLFTSTIIGLISIWMLTPEWLNHISFSPLVCKLLMTVGLLLLEGVAFITVFKKYNKNKQ